MLKTPSFKAHKSDGLNPPITQRFIANLDTQGNPNSALPRIDQALPRHTLGS